MVSIVAPVPRTPAPVGPDQLVVSVHEVMRSLMHRIHPTLEAEGISMGQFWALHLVSSLEAASVSAVARHLSVSAPTVCANVDTLEASGLVTRRRSERDHRAVELALTPMGKKVESRVWARLGRLMGEAAGDLPREDVATAIRVFRAMNRRLDPSPSGSEGAA